HTFSSPSTAAAPPSIYTLSLHDALPIWQERQLRLLRHGRHRNVRSPDRRRRLRLRLEPEGVHRPQRRVAHLQRARGRHLREHERDRKSTRLNSSHLGISYAVFCLKKKKS